MISRRTIRIKVLQVLYAYYASSDKSIANSEKELAHALSKSYDLYHHLLALLTELADFAQRRIDTNLAKLVPTYEDLHPNTRFVDNRIIALLRVNRRLQAYLSHAKPPGSTTPNSSGNSTPSSPNRPSIVNTSKKGELLCRRPPLCGKSLPEHHAGRRGTAPGPGRGKHLLE